MNPIQFSYRTIRYVHDPVIAQAMNIGVMVYAPSKEYLGYQFIQHYGRLAAAFSGFSASSLRLYINSLESALLEVATNILRGDLARNYLDLDQITHIVLPDLGGCFQVGPVMGGITDDVCGELDSIFTRFVCSPTIPPRIERKDDTAVWRRCRESIPVHLRTKLTDYRFETPEFTQLFEHTVKNGKVHVLQPVSLDYRAKPDIQRRAVELLGIGTVLQDVEELGSIYLLLGAPQDESMLPSYRRARDLMAQMPVKHQIIEEDDIADFGKGLENLLHSV